MIERIQVFGLQCSGTNILFNLLKDNFNIPICGTYGSKHGTEETIKWKEIEEDKDKVLFVHIHKNVFDWTVSMRNAPHGAMPVSLSFDKILKQRWKARDFPAFDNIYRMREYVFGTLDKIKDSVPHWYNLDYLDFLRDSEGFLSSLTSYGLKATMNMNSLTKYKGQSGKFKRKDYDLRGEYRRTLGLVIVDEITKLYDDSNERRLLNG